MQTILTTADLSPRDAFESWHDVVRGKIGAHKSMPIDRNNFYAELKVGDLTDLSLLTWKSAPLTGHICHIDDLVLLVSNCTAHFSEFTMTPDVLCLVEARTPMAYRTEPLDHVGLRIPWAILARRISISKEIANRPIPRRGSAALLANFLRSLTLTGPSTLSPSARIVAREHALDLTALMLGTLAGVAPELTSPERVMVAKLRIAIETQLTNRAADRASIAAAAGISERHANRLLARESTSITELFRKRRLAKCREALELSDRSIADIAREFGWTLATNFVRDFKAEFGLTPREARLLIYKK
jgi:AraC family transcriptional regulator, positive regulator of tynA and feaB